MGKFKDLVEDRRNAARRKERVDETVVGLQAIGGSPFRQYDDDFSYTPLGSSTEVEIAKLYEDAENSLGVRKFEGRLQLVIQEGSEETFIDLDDGEVAKLRELLQ